MGRRRAGDGLIRYRSDGRWEGRIVVGYDENGLPKTKNVLAKTKNECREKLSKLKVEINPVEQETSGEPTFGEWLEEWYRTYIKPGVRPGTREVYENRIYKHIIPAIGSLPLKVLTPEEMQRFLIQAKCDGFYEIYLVALSTGLRLGELLALQWRDLNFKSGELTIRRSVRRTNGELLVSEPKTSAGHRMMILPQSVVAVRKEYRKSVDSRWMFPSPKKEDSPRDPSSARKRMKAVLERAGCKEVRFHDLRHTFASLALEHGIDIKTLSAVIGHASAATTLNIYAHVTDAMQEQAARIKDKGIAGCDATEGNVGKRTVAPSDFKAAPARKVGYVKQLSPNCWQGRYSPRLPDGTRFVKNVYAPTEAECREKLAALVQEMRAEMGR